MQIEKERRQGHVEEPDLANPFLKDCDKPNFVTCAPGAQPSWTQAITSERISDSKRQHLRLQDADLRELRDEGLCLSMHQPWASLLIAGIKRVEGRSWYTAHRGRLWIAATARNLTPDEIAAVEGPYRTTFPSSAFPDHYPTGCLLGCVQLDDCLTRDEYQQRSPSQLFEESDTEFVFLCSVPQQLLLKFPMKGKHKICKFKAMTYEHVILFLLSCR